MQSAGRHVAALSDSIGLRLPLYREGHLALQNDMRGIGRVRVLGIIGIGGILPNIGVPKPSLASCFVNSVSLMS
jgi:hypothetical protein